MIQTFRNPLLIACFITYFACGPKINPVDEYGSDPTSGNPLPMPPNKPDPTATLSWNEQSLPMLKDVQFKKIFGVASIDGHQQDLFLITTNNNNNDTLWHIKGNDISAQTEQLLTDYRINDVHGKQTNQTNSTITITAVGYTHTPYDGCMVFGWSSDSAIKPTRVTNFQKITWRPGDNPTQGPSVTCQEQKAVFVEGRNYVSVGDSGIFTYEGITLQTFPAWSNLFGYDSLNHRVFSTRTLTGIWGSDGIYWAVGANGTIAFVKQIENLYPPQRGSWTIGSKTSYNLNAIFGIGSNNNNIIVVGDQGSILKYDGSAWDVLDLPEVANVNLGTVYGLPSGEYYIGGQEGKFITYKDANFKVETLPIQETILSIFAFDMKNIYAVTQSKIFRYSPN